MMHVIESKLLDAASSRPPDQPPNNAVLQAPVVAVSIPTPYSISIILAILLTLLGAISDSIKTFPKTKRIKNTFHPANSAALALIDWVIPIFAALAAFAQSITLEGPYAEEVIENVPQNIKKLKKWLSQCYLNPGQSLEDLFFEVMTLYLNLGGAIGQGIMAMAGISDLGLRRELACTFGLADFIQALMSDGTEVGLIKDLMQAAFHQQWRIWLNKLRGYHSYDNVAAIPNHTLEIIAQKDISETYNKKLWWSSLLLLGIPVAAIDAFFVDSLIPLFADTISLDKNNAVYRSLYFQIIFGVAVQALAMDGQAIANYLSGREAHIKVHKLMTKSIAKMIMAYALLGFVISFSTTAAFCEGTETADMIAKKDQSGYFWLAMTTGLIDVLSNTMLDLRCFKNGWFSYLNSITNKVSIKKPAILALGWQSCVKNIKGFFHRDQPIQSQQPQIKSSDDFEELLPPAIAVVAEKTNNVSTVSSYWHSCTKGLSGIFHRGWPNNVSAQATSQPQDIVLNSVL